MALKSDMTLPLVISAGIHIGVLVILIMGVDFSEKPKPQIHTNAPVMQAVVVDQNKVAQHVERLKAEKKETERKEKARQDELERKAKQARQEREREQAQIKKLELQRKQKELETKNANAAAKVAQQKEKQAKELAQKAEVERKQKEKERQASEEAAKKAVEKRKKEELAAKKMADERKRKAEVERKRKAEELARKQQEQMMQDALAAEQASLSQTRNKQVMSEVQRYTSMIVATISRNVQQEDSMRGKSCKVWVRLAKDGFVTSSRIVDGDPVLCRATQAAIQKVQRLPISSEPDVYDKLKELNIIYRPEFN
ncbi:cell envelope integrity protein TolA [Shewanella sp. D64]|uniref:cell envelope integrity protein TolA n=1 Tax=unclassified Shewanella TaxID=196818 RepID=UPI0022BA123E|nr:MULTISPECIES: cell envelope integrity protein TolA [unclassified Shewanella]MEC4728330.1 cell envelope integrity protein TolA [Shewanella sp. D64]MEC4740403.1 cell envelope integrity protein TolA [Shewanella sp. E94]WBJ93299.1 cell envelope integrity protein TolA [Shewanella sp. MTB7]